MSQATCRWILLQTIDERNQQVCGAPVEEGSHYCPQHMKVMLNFIGSDAQSGDLGVTRFNRAVFTCSGPRTTMSIPADWRTWIISSRPLLARWTGKKPRLPMIRPNIAFALISVDCPRRNSLGVEYNLLRIQQSQSKSRGFVIPFPLRYFRVKFPCNSIFAEELPTRIAKSPGSAFQALLEMS
jgi:hypothetical protein